jgi:hypothetical protein
MNDIPIPPELVNTPISEWQLNAVTVVIGAMVIGRIWTAITRSGGLVGIWKSLVFGVTPDKKP